MYFFNKDASVVWRVGDLCKAIGVALESRFNPVTVQGEISNFSHSSSGHCYFSLKDDSGQMRCAMFKRSMLQLERFPKDGDKAKVQGRLGVYEARGDLQLVVHTLQYIGQGNLYEQFLQLKNKLEREGLFETERKRLINPMPRAIAVVTSLKAAALHDVLSTLQRRVPHIPVLISSASVQGADAPAELAQALQSLFAYASNVDAPIKLDTILLVRGGGSIEDLWSFNDEILAKTIAQSPIPIISGVGHETDFTIADFVADARAPTPSIAAEMAAVSQLQLQETVNQYEDRMRRATQRMLDKYAQRLDLIQAMLLKPASILKSNHVRLSKLGQALTFGMKRWTQNSRHQVELKTQHFQRMIHVCLQRQNDAMARLTLQWQALDPDQVLKRGYVRLESSTGEALSSVDQLQVGSFVLAHLQDGQAYLMTQEVQNKNTHHKR